MLHKSEATLRKDCLRRAIDVAFCVPDLFLRNQDHGFEHAIIVRIQ